MRVEDSSFFSKTPRPTTASEVERLRVLIYTDDLTGLYNRRFFRHCIDEQRTQSMSTQSSFALLMIDIDHFKQINDTYGHAVGDAALIQIANLLKEEMREKGWVFRYAGDEFVAIARNCDEVQARVLCSRLLNQVSFSLLQRDLGFPFHSISLSIGFAIYPVDTDKISELMELSDRALYTSKHKGRNSFTSAAEIAAEEKEQLQDWPIQVECPSLIGRQREWNILQHHFSECRTGHGRLLFVSGEAGIGKTRLISHFIKRRRSADFHILSGECSEGTLIHSYAPIRDALTKGFEAKDPATVNVYRNLDKHHRSELISLVPQFDRFEKGTLDKTTSPDRYLLLESLLLLLQGMASQLPTILVLEDIHWSDEATLHLLQYLARNVRNQRLLLFCTFRDEEVMHSILPSALQNMSRENLFETVHIKPLTAEETTVMVKEIFRGYSVSDSFSQWIYQESEGNPFYVEELIKLLLEEGYIRRYNREVELQRPDKFLLPYSIRALIQRRVSRLDESLQRILGYASIIGYEFDLNILSRLIEENEGFVLDLLDRLIKMQLIRESSAQREEFFEFTHNKIRDVIYEDMGVIKRRKFHQRVAELIESLHPGDIQVHAENLAYHFERGGNLVKACLFSVEAGKKALQLHAYQDALMHFNRCFQYQDLHEDLMDNFPAEKLAELYTQKGFTLEALGRWEEAIRCYEFLLTLKTVEAPATVEADGLNHLCRIFYKRDDFTKSSHLAQRVLELSQQLDYFPGVRSGHENLGKNYWRMCDYEKAFEHLNAAIQMANLENDTVAKAGLLNNVGVVCRERSNHDRAIGYFQRAMEIFQQREEKQGTVECLVNLSMSRQQQGHLHEARQHLVNAFALAQEIGDPLAIANSSVHQASVEFKLANYEMGSRMNECAGRIYSEMADNLGLSYYLENEAYVQAIKGRLQQALQATQRAGIAAAEKRLTKRELELLRSEASTHYYLGQYQNALKCLNRIILESERISDSAAKAEAMLKLGFVFLAMNDLEKAADQWHAVLHNPAPLDSLDFLFWKTAAAGFLASMGQNQDELLALQKETIAIAERSECASFITLSYLLSSYQFQVVRHLEQALLSAEESQKMAELYGQDLWLMRSAMKIFELVNELGRPVPAEQVRELLVRVKQEGQNDMMNRCYRLLSDTDLSLKEEWRAHWESWKEQIPEEYHPAFSPVLRS